MSRILYFDPRRLGGHRVEYLHHFYDAARCDNDNEYIILTGNNFYNVSKEFKWERADNIEIVLADEKNMDNPNDSSIQMAKRRCIYLRFIIDKYKIDKIFFVNLINQMPLLPFYVNKNIKIKGIIYKIPFYSNSESLIKRLRNYIIYFLFAKCRQFDSIYLLNSNDAVDYYNKLFKSKKFKYLPDPFAHNESLSNIDIRELFNINRNTIVFSQFGYLSKGKGTCEILKCFINLEDEYKTKTTLILAGEVDNSIKDEFYDLVRIAKDNHVNIHIKDSFVAFDYIYAICSISNFILMPYESGDKSSGMFGYSSYFNVPLIASNTGLIAEIVNRYRLGFCLDNINALGISSFIKNHLYDKISISDEYLKSHSLDKFKMEIIR